MFAKKATIVSIPSRSTKREQKANFPHRHSNCMDQNDSEIALKIRGIMAKQYIY